MKVAIVTQYYAPEAIRIPDTLARQLRSRGHEVRVITGYPNYPDGVLFPGYVIGANRNELIDGVQVRRVALIVSHSYNPVLRTLNYLTFAWGAAFARGWVRAADIVYVYATQMTPAIGPSIWRPIFRMPYVMHIQDLWPESVTGSTMIRRRFLKRVVDGLLRPWLGYLYRTSSAIVAIAPSMKRMLLERGVPEDKVSTVLNWSATEASVSRRAASVRDDTVTIVYAGNLGDHQALDNVIEAANLVKHIKNLRIVIVGSGVAEERLRALVKSLDAYNVIFKGRVPPEQMGEIHAQSDFELVSLRDLDIFDGTIPSKFQASLFHGIPVITTVRGDVMDLVRANGLGFACEPEDPVGLANAFAEAAQMPADGRAVMGKSAKAFYERSMSVQRGVDQIEKVLVAAARSPRRQAKSWY